MRRTTGPQVWRRGAMPEFGTAEMAGFVSSVLYMLCGAMVTVFGPLVPGGPHVHRAGLLALGLVAVATGIVIGRLPWRRWTRASSLWLIPLSFGFITTHNLLSGDNGFRYDVFYFVVYAWIGLMHPAGTSLKSAPLFVVSYLAPAVWLHDWSPLSSAMAYALPVCLLVGECASIVASRLHASEQALRANEERLSALVHNASDVITVVGADAVVHWDSPAITTVLGYRPDERVGRMGLDYVHPDHLEDAQVTLAGLIDEPDKTRVLELQVRHADGSWRWVEVRARNLLAHPAVGGLVINMTDVTERHEAEAVGRRLAAIVESSNDAIIGQRVDGTIVSWNSAAESMYQYPAEQAIGRNIRRLVPAERHAELDALLARVAAGESVAGVETQRVRRDGTTIDVSLSLAPVRDARGRVAAVAAIARDITAQVQARRALADREASFRLLFAANPQPMWVYDAKTLQFLEVNEAAVRHYGYSREDFLRLLITDIRPLEDVDVLMKELGEDRVRRQTDGWRHLLADGRIIDVEVTSHRLEFNGHDAVLVSVRDVTDRNALDAQLRHQAFHDSLTGLSNRALFTDRVEHALGRRVGDAQPVVLLLDLDRFKMVNDSLGHAAGDEMLVEAARRLEDSVRLGDTVARLGGDEFAILLEDCPHGRAEAQATRLLQALSVPMRIGGREVTTTASVGIAAATPLVSAGELLRNADVAMYRAKSAGGGRFQVFQPAMYAAAARQMELTAAMRQALANDEFVLHYQPVVDVRNGRVTAMEALTRWQHPDHGLMSPLEFIPIAEESGLIVELGEWVLRQACLAAAGWAGDGKVNVNLSGRQLADPDIVEQVHRALHQSGLEPSRLTLEITESVVMQHSEANVRRLGRLRDLGVSLAIDDFGTGYSSLAYLRAFPVHELKIDKSFIAALPDDEEAVALVRTILQLARSLSLGTVAEGVETAEQYAALSAIGCDRVQGYYIGTPRPWADAVALVAPPSRSVARSLTTFASEAPT